MKKASEYISRARKFRRKLSQYRGPKAKKMRSKVVRQFMSFVNKHQAEAQADWKRSAMRDFANTLKGVTPANATGKPSL